MDSNLTVAEFVVVSCRTTHLPERVTLFYRISQALVVSNIVHSFVRGGGGGTVHHVFRTADRERKTKKVK